MDYQSDQYRALFASAPAIAADYVDEMGDEFGADALRGAIPPPKIFVGLDSGRGSGLDSGRGSGLGSGRGSGSGSGSGFGFGSGRGIGIGRGSGRGIGTKLQEVHQMEIGKAYLIHAGDWHTFVGRCVRQIGPFTYVLNSCSKMDTNQGDVWHKLVAGDEEMRRRCHYWHDDGERIVVLSITCVEWMGKTPQESGYEGQTS